MGEKTHHSELLEDMYEEVDELRKTIVEIYTHEEEIEKEIEESKTELIKICNELIEKIEDISSKIKEFEKIPFKKEIFSLVEEYVDSFGPHRDSYVIEYTDGQIVQFNDNGNIYYGDYLEKFNAMELIIILKNLTKVLKYLKEEYFYCRFENKKIKELLKNYDFEDF